MRHGGQPNMFGWRAPHGSGGCRPPPPFAAPLRCALTPAATPRFVARATWSTAVRIAHEATHGGSARSRASSPGEKARRLSTPKNLFQKLPGFRVREQTCYSHPRTFQLHTPLSREVEGNGPVKP